MNKKAIIEYLSKNIDYSNEQKEIIKAIEDAKEEMYRAMQYFDTVSEPQLVDYAIYMDQAAKARYAYLLDKAKSNGIKVDTNFMLSDVNTI